MQFGMNVSEFCFNLSILSPSVRRVRSANGGGGDFWPVVASTSGLRIEILVFLYMCNVDMPVRMGVASLGQGSTGFVKISQTPSLLSLASSL